MNKDLVIAKFRRWQAELREMVAELEHDGKYPQVAEILNKRAKEVDDFIVTVQDGSLIPSGDVLFQPDEIVDEISDKVKKVKEGVKKLDALKKEKSKILKDLAKD